MKVYLIPLKGHGGSEKKKKPGAFKITTSQTTKKDPWDFTLISSNFKSYSSS